MTEQRPVCHSHLENMTKKATGDCVVFHKQLMAGSHKTEKHQSSLKAFVDGEMGTFGSFMIDFSLANESIAV